MTAIAAPVHLAAGRWSVVDQRTRATFTVRNLGFLVVHGSIAVRHGDLDVDDSGAPVRLRAELELDTIATGIAKRDADLRKPGLLDIDRHPTMTYTAEHFRSGPEGWHAEGRLALRGTSCPLVLTGAPESASAGGFARVRATATLDRTAVGIRAPRLMIGREIHIEIDAWLTPPEG